MSHARPIHPGVTYLITRRTERRHCLLRPDAQMTQFILFAFVMAARRYDIQVHAFCAMSTHVHYVVTDPNATLPRFLEMFHRLVARGVKIMRKWDGAVWDRAQTSVVKLEGRQAIVEKIAYVLANPVSAGLVRRAHQWPGAKTRVQDIGQRKIRAQRPNVYFNPKNRKWLLHAELDVLLPPTITKETSRAFRDDIAHALTKLEKAAHARYAPQDVLGAKHAATVPPERRITTAESAGQHNPTFAVGRGNAQQAQAVADELLNFRIAYGKALVAWRTGDRSVKFPAGTYAMRVLHGANIAR